MAKAKPRTGELTTKYYGWVKPTVGASDDAWGGYINGDLDGIDTIVHGVQTSIPTVPSPSATQPVMDGSATAGSSAQWSRGDHVHPTDTTRAPLTGVSNGANAAAGQVGEYIIGSGGGGSMTTATPANVAAQSLTAGDWDVVCRCSFTPSGSPSAWATIALSVSNVSGGLLGGSLPDQGCPIMLQATFNPTAVQEICTGRARVNISATTLIYGVAQVNFTGGTITTAGQLMCRRVR